LLVLPYGKIVIKRSLCFVMTANGFTPLLQRNNGHAVGHQ